ncbi:MAG: PhoD-like phosphatase N-terminal domain-containing protein, partial [Lysobacterales bacterium]
MKKLVGSTRSSPAFVLAVLCLSACNNDPQPPPYCLGQGLMAGEATATSVILQARLTMHPELIEGHSPGQAGFGRFEIDTDPGFPNAVFSNQLEALPANDFILKHQFENLEPGKRYYYRLRLGADEKPEKISDTATFRTLPGKSGHGDVSFVAATGMNYYHHYFGKYEA